MWCAEFLQIGWLHDVGKREEVQTWKEKMAAYLCHGECVERHISRCVLNIKERGGSLVFVEKIHFSLCCIYCAVLFDLDALSLSLNIPNHSPFSPLSYLSTYLLTFSNQSRPTPSPLLALSLSGLTGGCVYEP